MQLDAEGGAKIKTKLVSEGGWTSEYTPKLAKSAETEFKQVSDQLSILKGSADELQSQDELIQDQFSSRMSAEVILKSIDTYGQLLKRYSNKYKSVLGRVQTAQRVTHENLLQLKGVTSREDPRVERDAKAVQIIYGGISGVLEELSSVPDKQLIMDEKLKSFRRHLESNKAPVEEVMTQGQELKKSETRA